MSLFQDFPCFSGKNVAACFCMFGPDSIHIRRFWVPKPTKPSLFDSAGPGKPGLPHFFDPGRPPKGGDPTADTHTHTRMTVAVRASNPSTARTSFVSSCDAGHVHRRTTSRARAVGTTTTPAWGVGSRKRLLVDGDGVGSRHSPHLATAPPATSGRGCRCTRKTQHQDAGS